MNWFFELPPELRIGLVFVVGVVAGTQVNRGIYRLAFHRRSIGPWSKPDPKAPPRHWFDYVPIFGWCGLSRESQLHGRGYWVRPLLIELLLGVGLAALYWWEVQERGLLPASVLPNAWGASAFSLTAQSPERVHAQFLAHAILIVLMTVASFIDIDERTIPGEITDFGALLGMLLAAVLPISRLPDWDAFANVPPTADGWTDQTLLFATSPLAWPSWLNGPQGLALVLLAFCGWWIAIVPTTLATRHGLFRALRYFLGSLRRRVWPRAHRQREGSRLYVAVLGFGWSVVALVWLLRATVGIAHWQALSSAIIGMVVGGAIVWAVRIVGSHAMKQEAMGFGDVTLVAMIGAFLGWQPCLMLFFLAPFIGVVIAVLNFLIRRDKSIWFGPFLCAAAVVVIVGWGPLWEEYGRTLFAVGGGTFIPSIMALLFPLMWAMLFVWRLIKERLLFPEKLENNSRGPTARAESGRKK